MRRTIATWIILTGAIGFVVVVVVSLCGCASLLSLEASKREAVNDRVCAMNNSAIRGVALNNGGGIGVDVSNWSAITNHPWRQIGAALLDAGTAYTAYKGAQQLLSSSGQSASPPTVNVTIGGGQNNVVNINP